MLRERPVTKLYPLLLSATEGIGYPARPPLLLALLLARSVTSVQLGRDLGDSVEVLAGLSPSDRIINNPPETLITGDAVRVAGTTPQAAGVVSSSSTARQ